MFYTLKSHLNMYKKPEERLDRLQEMCRRWHVPCKAASAKQENASLGRLALQFMGSVANQLHSSSLRSPLRWSHDFDIWALGSPERAGHWELIIADR